MTKTQNPLQELRASIDTITKTSEELTRLNAVRTNIGHTSSLFNEGVCHILSMIESEMVQVRAMSDRVDRMTDSITAETKQIIRELDEEIARLNQQMDTEIDAALAITEASHEY